MSAPAHRVLHEVFGLPGFRGEQEAIISHVIAGGDAIVLMPTGGGKSLCYQIPALCRPGVALVVSPLIALMRNQVDILSQLGVRAAALNSSLSANERTEIRAALRAGRLDLLYVSPERLLDTLRQTQISLIAVDEAHCVSQWGHDFRTEYMRLPEIFRNFPGVPRMALTATADQQTREDIRRRLELDSARLFLASFDRPNIRYAIAPKSEPRRQIMSFLKAHAGESGIVYCLSRATVDETAAGLKAAGINALPYHAGLDPATRTKHQDMFLREDGLVLVATVAFGMGIDKPDIRFVAHYDLPGSLEAFYQETGRAGRDGLPAETLLLYGTQDLVMRRNMIAQGTAPDAVKRVERAKLDALLGVCETSACRRQALLAHFGEVLAEPCGNCDTCLTPEDTWDGLIAAQKALSAAKRTQQRFGAGHLTDILLGASTEKIKRFEHDKLPTFGVGKELSRTQWGSVFRQLIARGAIEVDHDSFGAFRITELGGAILRGQEKVVFRRDQAPASAAAAVKKRERLPLDAASEALFGVLKAERLNLARAQGVPAYVIFHDQTLAAIATARPGDLPALEQIPGMGKSKIERYGARILEVIKEYQGK
jgi:ATP-dependent DNA helicase RecQ